VAIEELGELPAAGPLLRRAATGAAGAAVFRRPPPRPLPLETELLVRDVAVDLDHLARYDRVCGFRLGDELPPTYPHVLAFPLALELMTRSTFPFPLPGLVHTDNQTHQVRPPRAGERFDIRVKAENLRDHERGRAVDLVTVVATGGVEVWRERSTYLRKDRKGTRTPNSTAPPAPAPPAQATWRVGPDVGRAYARASGDRNPIHTSTLAARLFGFRRPIAHGMWSLARSLAALEGRIPDQCTVDATFRLPILLPATVAFTSTMDGEVRHFALHDAASGRPHLSGTVR
jgi:MaoC like domain